MRSEHSVVLSKNGIHIWTLCTRLPEVTAAGVEPVLTDDDRRRAAGFRFEHLRNSFLVTRGILRCLLGCYLDLPPASVRFNYGSDLPPENSTSDNLESPVMERGFSDEEDEA
jgi:phosphopantetheinyl transferase